MHSVSLARIVVALALALGVGVHPALGQLTCANFTQAYQADCQYIRWFPGLDNDDEQTLLEQLLDETYPEEYELYPLPGYDDIGLRVLTDMFTYKAGDEIHVTIFPQGLTVALTYGDDTFFAQNIAVLVAQEGQNTIQAQYGSETYTRLITVRTTDRLILASRIFFFGLIMYFIFALVTRSSFFARWRADS